MLTPNEKRTRVVALAGLPAAVLLFNYAPLDAVPGWLPTSCGAASGLPCIFCGMTRALRCLLNGDPGRALYFNWLIFPLALVAIGWLLVCAAELSLGRRLVRDFPTFRLTRKSFASGAIALLLLWMLQVYLAVSQHKTELLNPNGPLYSLVVR